MNLQPLILSGFRRVNDHAAPDLLQLDEAAILQDVVLDYKLGKPIKRGHWSRYDDGVSAGYDIDCLNDIDIDGTDFLLAAINTGANTEIDKYDIASNTWGGYIGGLTAGAKFKMIPFADSYIITFDTDDEPRQVDKTSGLVSNLELGVADVSTIQSFHANGGSLTQNAHYRYCIVGRTEDGQYGAPSKPFTHYYNTSRFLSTDDDTVSTKIYWKNLPYIDDARIVSRMILRTKGEAVITSNYKVGFVFYLLTILDNDSTGTEYQTEFEDNIADSDLGTEIAVYLNMPTKATHIAFSNERLFFGNFSQYKRNFISPPSSNNGGTPPLISGEIIAEKPDRDFSSASAWANVDLASYNETGDLTITADDIAQSCKLAEANAPQTTGHDYVLKFTVSNIVGSWHIYNFDGSNSFGTVSSNGDQELYFTANGVAGIGIFSVDANSSGDFDNFSLKEVSTDYVDGYALTIADDTDNGGTLLNSTQYDYRIHYEDKFGRLSQYYLDIGTTTDASGTHANFHDLTINGIGSISDLAAEEYPNVVIFRRTGGTGSYYLIARVSIKANDIVGDGYSWLRRGQFTDLGAPDMAETWLDPDDSTNIESFPAGIAFSEISSPSTFRDEDKRQIFYDDGDKVEGMFDDQEGVVIFKTNNIYKIYTEGPSEQWTLVRIVPKYGCTQPVTLQKSGNSFYFIYNKKCYRYDYGAAEPDNIGGDFQSTLDSIVTWYDSRINDDWYMIQCKTSGEYLTLVYDIKLSKRFGSPVWYKWKRYQSVAQDFKTLHIIKYGSDKNKILSNADDYVSVYNVLTPSSSASRVDTEIGSNQQIAPSIESKVFKFPDGITKARLRKLNFDYLKMDDQTTTLQISDKDGQSPLTLTDTTNGSSNFRLYEKNWADTDALKESRAFSIKVYGAGFLEWDNLRLEYRPIHKGKQVSA